MHPCGAKTNRTVVLFYLELRLSDCRISFGAVLNVQLEVVFRFSLEIGRGEFYYVVGYK